MTGPAPKLLPLRIRLPYTAEEEFIERYGSNVGRGGVFVATRALKPEGTGLAFEFVLADGTRLLRGEGVVSKAQPDVGNARAGMTVRFTKLDAASKALIDRIVARRAGTEAEREDPTLASPSAPRTEPASLPPGLVRKAAAVAPSRPSMRMAALPPARSPGEATPIHREVLPLPGTPGVPPPGTAGAAGSARRAPDVTPKAPVPAPVVEAPHAVAPPVLAEPDEPVSLFPEHEAGEEALASIPDVGPSRDARGNKSIPGMPQRSTREMFTVRSASAESPGMRPETKDWKAPPASSGSFPAVRLPSESGSTAQGGSSSVAGREPVRPTDPDPFESSEETTDAAGTEAFALFTEPEFPEGRAETPVWNQSPVAPPAFEEEAPSPGTATSESAPGLDATAMAGLTPASVDAFDPNGVLGEVHAAGLSQEEPASHADAAVPSDTGATPDARFDAGAVEAASQDTPAFVEAESTGVEAARTGVATDVEQPLDFDVDLHMDAEEGTSPEASAPEAADGALGVEPTESASEPEPEVSPSLTASEPLRAWEQDAAPRNPEAERLLAWGIDPASIQREASALPEEVDPFAAALEQAVATSDPADLFRDDEIAASRSDAPATKTPGSDDEVAMADDRTGASPDAGAVFDTTATPEATEPHVTAPFESRAEEPAAEWAFSPPVDSESPADEAQAAWPRTDTETFAPVETPAGALSEEDAWTALVGATASPDAEALASGSTPMPEQEAAQAGAVRAEEAPFPPALTHAEQFAQGEDSPDTGVSSAAEFHAEEASSSEAATFQSEGSSEEAASAEFSTTHAASTVEEASTEGVVSDADAAPEQSLNHAERSHASLADPAAEAFADAIPVEEGWDDEEPSVFTVDSEPTSGAVADHRGETVAGQTGIEPSAADSLEPASEEAPPLPISTSVASVEAGPEGTDPSATEPASLFAGDGPDSGVAAHASETFSQEETPHDGSATPTALPSLEAASLYGQPDFPSVAAHDSEPEVSTSVGQEDASSPAQTTSDFVASTTEASSPEAGFASPTDPTGAATLEEALSTSKMQSAAGITAADTDWVGAATLAKASSVTDSDPSAEKTGTATSEAVTPPEQDTASTAPDPLALTTEPPDTATHTAPSEGALRADSSSPSWPDTEDTAADPSATGTVRPGEAPHEEATSAPETTPTRVGPSTDETQHAAAVSAASKEPAPTSDAALREPAGSAAAKELESATDAASREAAASAVSQVSVSTTDAAPHAPTDAAAAKESASTADAAPREAAASAASKDSASTPDAASPTVSNALPAPASATPTTEPAESNTATPTSAHAALAIAEAASSTGPSSDTKPTSTPAPSPT
ncbi:TIGR02266 family protein, partial [Corallococcus terminator]